MHQPFLVPTLRLALLAFSIAGASACRAPAPLDPESALPKVPRIELESERPTILVEIAKDQPADALPSDLMAGSSGAPTERFRRTIEGAMKSTGHFKPVPEDPDFRLEVTVQEVKVETKEDLGMIDWFMWKFFGRYLVASVRLGGVLYDKAGQQVGPNIEELGEYRIVSGKAFRSAQDLPLNHMGMGSSFAKTGSPAASNAMQKAIAKLISAVAEATDQENPYSEPLEKEVGE